MRVRSFFPDTQTVSHMLPSTSSSIPPPDSTPYNTFDDLVALYRMPPPGPDYFRARRQLWLTSRSDRPRKSSQHHETITHKKLVEVLQTPDAVYSDACWKNGIEKAWRGLSKGERLRHRLALNLTIKILHASWVRDETWPAGMRAPEPDDELPEGVVLEPMILERINTTTTSSASFAIPEQLAI
ncbi:hypothetical protein AN958_05459 [Leucoagaricus sp. SymC.cos]|nr:hypothetical protein AN958_05459 [Leucoagaricus sp. SymC.cos]